MIAIPNIEKPKGCWDCFNWDCDHWGEHGYDNSTTCPLIEIVRCGECKWQNVNTETGFHGCGHRFGLVKANDDSFCSYGERPVKK